MQLIISLLHRFYSIVSSYFRVICQVRLIGIETLHFLLPSVLLVIVGISGCCYRRYSSWPLIGMIVLINLVLNVHFLPCFSVVLDQGRHTEILRTEQWRNERLPLRGDLRLFSNRLLLLLLLLLLLNYRLLRLWLRSGLGHRS